jgi:UDP-N-acetylglucosamine/UDP-N-acetylgalactosamine diphosphorylase
MMSDHVRSLEDRVRAKLDRFGQMHVLKFWEELDASQRQRILSQADVIDLRQIRQLCESWREGGEADWAETARRAEPPRAIRPHRHTERASGTDSLDISADDARCRGMKSLREGQVGVLLVAGGQGSRLGFERSKGLYPIGPVSGASLLQVHCEKVLATSNRYRVRVPLYLMTSPATHDETIVYLEENRRFGLAPDDVIVFCQGTMPAVDAQTGDLLLEEKDRLFMSPDGHGGTVAALAASGAMDDARQRGLTQLFYFQVDNPLTPVCDAELLGYHLLANSELSSVAVAKETPLDRVGNFVSINGKLHVIEYIDFPEDVASRREADGSLTFWAGNTAIHVFDVQFLGRVLNLADAMPFHIQHKKVPYLDENGRYVDPAVPNALKFERFIFDLLPHAKGAIVIEADEEQVFAPLKNAPGAKRDTPEFVHQRLIKQHRQWLRQAGVKLADGVPVEISPLYALDAAEVAGKPDLPQAITTPTYLRKSEMR